MWRSAFPVTLGHQASPLLLGKSRHCQGTSANAEPDTLDSKVFVVASTTVNVVVGSVVQACGIETLPAVRTGEAPLVPDPVLTDHLFSSVHSKATSGAPRLAVTLESVQWSTIGAASKTGQILFNSCKNPKLL